MELSADADLHDAIGESVHKPCPPLLRPPQGGEPPKTEAEAALRGAAPAGAAGSAGASFDPVGALSENGGRKRPRKGSFADFGDFNWRKKCAQFFKPKFLF